MAVVKVAVIGWAFHLMSAIGKMFAPLSAAGVDCYKQILESLMMTSFCQINSCCIEQNADNTDIAYRRYCDVAIILNPTSYSVGIYSMHINGYIILL